MQNRPGQYMSRNQEMPISGMLTTAQAPLEYSNFAVTPLRPMPRVPRVIDQTPIEGVYALCRMIDEEKAALLHKDPRTEEEKQQSQRLQLKEDHEIKLSKIQRIVTSGKMPKVRIKKKVIEFRKIEEETKDNTFEEKTSTQALPNKCSHSVPPGHMVIQVISKSVPKKSEIAEKSSKGHVWAPPVAGENFEDQLAESEKKTGPELETMWSEDVDQVFEDRGDVICWSDGDDSTPGPNAKDLKSRKRGEDFPTASPSLRDKFLESRHHRRMKKFGFDQQAEIGGYRRKNAVDFDQKAAKVANDRVVNTKRSGRPFARTGNEAETRKPATKPKKRSISSWSNSVLELKVTVPKRKTREVRILEEEAKRLHVDKLEWGRTRSGKRFSKI